MQQPLGIETERAEPGGHALRQYAFAVYGGLFADPGDQLLQCGRCLACQQPHALDQLGNDDCQQQRDNDQQRADSQEQAHGAQAFAEVYFPNAAGQVLFIERHEDIDGIGDDTADNQRRGGAYNQRGKALYGRPVVRNHP